MAKIESLDGTPRDFPLADVEASCNRAIRNGGFILQKWTCAGCGQRITANNINVLVHHGHCEHCNHVTDLDERGCNFQLLIPSRAMTVAEMEQALGMAAKGIH